MAVRPSMKVPPTSYSALAKLLSEGLDLCVRARKLDDLAAKAVVASEITGTRCFTGALWVMDQYDRDLTAWQDASRLALQQLREDGSQSPVTSDGEVSKATQSLQTTEPKTPSTPPSEAG
jgi:hypothetical protein